MNSNDCFPNDPCHRFAFTPDCCQNPQTVPITSDQIRRLLAILQALIGAITAFLPIQVTQTD